MSEQFSGVVRVLDLANREVFRFDSQAAVLDLGAQGNEGDLRIRGDDGEFKFHFDGGRQLVSIRDAGGREVLLFDGPRAALYVGASGNEGDIIVRDQEGQPAIRLNGSDGDIILQNADCAEEFESAAGTIPPGIVVVLDTAGSVLPSTVAYDHRVAGIISGAGSHRPGIVLDRRTESVTRVPVAVVGKVFCYADADHGSIHVGDLMTTSSRPGYAMRADDPIKSVGAIIGKALGGLLHGDGLIPVLVGLR